MNIEQVIWSIDKTIGGPSRSVTQILKILGLIAPESKFHLHTAKTDNPILTGFDLTNVVLDFYSKSTLSCLIGLEQKLSQSGADLFHGQAIWDLPVHQMAKTARKLKVPYVISPRGMLDPWSLRQSKLKKQVALRLYQHDDLKRAACIHASATMEAENIRALGFKNPIAIIPNGIRLRDFPIKDIKRRQRKRKVLYLSRIHHQKGIELLIQAWSELSTTLAHNWSLDIIGNGDADYIKRLNQLILKKGIGDSTQIKEPIYGPEKIIAFQEADLFVLPSYSESFGIAIAEALACGTPVITTTGTPWQDLNKHGCGWHIPLGISHLKKTLEEALEMSEDTLAEKGRNGRKLIEKKYSMHAVAQQTYRLYRWLLNKETRPEFVI